MRKYGKSILSVAAAVAISSSMLYAEYMPLTTTANDNRWILFGVNGFHGSSGTQGTLGEFSISANDSFTWIDDDNDPETTMPSVANEATPSNEDFGWLDAIDGVAYVQVRVDTSGFTSEETDPVRTMYVSGTDGNVKFGFKYKAVLEGEQIEFQTSDGGDVYSTTLSSDSTYDNPVVAGSSAAPLAGQSGSTGSTLSSLDPADPSLYMVDYNLTNNPADINNYATSYSDANVDEILSIYAYDSSNGTWLYHDSRNDVAFNDFNNLENGRGYWAKLDADSDGTAANGDSQLSGLIMGSGNALGAGDYSGKLNEGWNLISFGSGSNELRRSTTGMIADIDTDTNSTGRTLQLFDSALNQNVTVTFDVNASDEVAAQNINYAIAKGKVDGTIQNVFDLKAFDTGTTGDGQIVLMSNKKFGLQDDNATVTNIASMAGSNLWVDTNNTSAGTSVDPVAGSIYTSTYGEYFLIVEPLTGGTTAESLGSASKVNVVASDGTSETADITTNLATSTTNLDGVSFANAIEVDVDSDGATDYALMSSAEPFYLRDMTIARTYKYVSDGAAGEIEVTNLPSKTDALDANITIADTNASDIASAISGTYDLLAYGDNTSDKIVVISSDGNVTATQTAKQSSINFGLSYVSGGDNLVVYESGSVITPPAGDYAKGAIGKVFAPNDFIKKTIQNSIVVDFNATTAPTGNDNNFTITVTNMFDVNWAAAEIAEPADMDTLVSNINTLLTEHNISSQAVATDADTITITGYDLIDASFSVDVNATTLNQSVTAASSGLGKLDASTTTASVASSDLKYNSKFTPNYVMSGPLYVMNDAGYKLEALVSGSTLMTDGTVNWESIDLTRDTADWLLTQDYNLFETDERAGYWAYLSEIGSVTTLSYTNASTGGENFKTYYETDGTATNFYSGNINITLSGISSTALADDSARVTATVAGEIIELTQESAGSTTYTGKVSLYDAPSGAATGSLEDVKITVADGLGNKDSFFVSELQIDNVKPEAPVVTYSSGTLTIAESNSSDVSGYYVFQNGAKETDTDNAALATYQPADFSAGTMVVSDICANASAVTAASSAGTLDTIAIDGSGSFGTGNSSDVASIGFMPIAKDRVVLADTQVTTDIDASTGGSDYNSSCVAESSTTENIYGLQITSYTDEVKIAFPKVVEGGPYTEAALVNVMYISDGTDVIAQVKFRDDYDGEEFFIQVTDGSTVKTYAGTLTKDTHDTDGTAYDMTTDGNGEKANVTF